VLAFGVAGWSLGVAMWTYYNLDRQMTDISVLSPADAAFLLLPIAGCVAMVLFPADLAGHSRIRLVLDGVIVEGSLFLIAWVLVLQNLFDSHSGNSGALGLSLASSVIDVVALTVALMVLTRAKTGERAPLTLIAVGVALMAVSDTTFLGLLVHHAYGFTNLVVVGWAGAMVALAIAGLVSLRIPPVVADPAVPLMSPVSLWLPYVPVVVATPILTATYLPKVTSGPVAAVAMVVVAAVLGRQFMVVATNRRLLHQVADQALRDPLTGLANRTLFADRLTHAVQLRVHDRRPLAVISVDLDDFKLVNDSLGHPAGDVVLSTVAERLLACVRPGDTVARLGGDEFAVLVEGDVDHVHAIAYRIIEAFEQPFVVDGDELMIRPSAGIAVASRDDPDVSADTLLKHADVAMYSAKRAGGDTVHTFSSGMRLIDPAGLGLPVDPLSGVPSTGAAAVRLLVELREAIDQNRLTVMYQPKFDLRTAAIVGVEALLRWPHPRRGMLSPDQFLPLIRQHGLMRAVTDLVLAQALDGAAQWHARGVHVPVAVNLFAPSLGDLTLPTKIRRVLAERGLPADALILEITEDLLLEDIGRARKVLETLRTPGIRIALDDFGTGYSALSYLRDLPIDEVKLDREFVAPVLSDPRAAAIVRAVIELAHALEVTTVAEGVENAETAWKLREYGCEIGQGFYYSPPLDALAVLDLLSSPLQQRCREAALQGR